MTKCGDTTSEVAISEDKKPFVAANWQYIKWQCHKMRRRIIQEICSKIYRDTDRDVDKSIIVAGTARSGTTWLADIIASQNPCRIMFEPFNPRKVNAISQFHYFQYMRPEEQNSELWSYCQRVFTGDIRHDWIDRYVDNLSPKYRLIKEIRANLFLKWIHDMFPAVPMLFLIRHPCAVVLSRMRLGWATDTDINPFLSQTDLVDDFLATKIDTIRRARTVEEKHAIIWCISNLIPFKQFNSGGLNVFFYENLCLKPEIEAPRIWRTIRQEYKDSVLEHFDKPSITTINSSAIVTGRDKLTRWKEELSPKQINSILSIVDNFGLGYIYSDSCTPLVSSP